MNYKKVVVNGEVIAGEDVEKVYCPESGDIIWRIVLKSGLIYDATGNVTVVTKNNKEGEQSGSN